MSDRIKIKLYLDDLGATCVEFISHDDKYVLRREIRPDSANYWWEIDGTRHPYFVFSDSIEVIDER